VSRQERAAQIRDITASKDAWDAKTAAAAHAITWRLDDRGGGYAPASSMPPRHRTTPPPADSHRTPRPGQATPRPARKPQPLKPALDEPRHLDLRRLPAHPVDLHAAELRRDQPGDHQHLHQVRQVTRPPRTGARHLLTATHGRNSIMTQPHPGRQLARPPAGEAP
jgi:hypothetical protein